METINAVNFEDLFDFSPEPVDRLSQDDREPQTSHLNIPPTKAPPNSYVSPSNSGNINQFRINNSEFFTRLYYQIVI